MNPTANARVILTLFGALISGGAAAQNTGGVLSPVVDTGHRSIEYRFGHDPKDDTFAQRLHYQQALDGERMWRIVAQVRDPGSGELDFDYVQGELFLQLTPDDSRWQRGLRLDLRLRDGERPNAVRLNWIHQLRLTPDWQARTVLRMSMDIGQQRREGLGLTTQMRIERSLKSGNPVGFDVYSNYGTSRNLSGLPDQSHQVGPYKRIHFRGGWTLLGRALFGVTDNTPDREIGLWLTRRF